LGSQKLLPEYYFSSAQFFVTRRDFRWKAVVFRLAIPLTAGLMVPVLPGVQNERAVAMAAGCFAWFLVLWPIAWAPKVMVPPLPQRSVRLIVALWIAWWVFFTFLPLSGAALLLWIREVLSDPQAPWWETQLAGELLTVIPLTVAAILVTRLVNKELPRLGDELFDEEEQWLDPEREYSARSGGSTLLDMEELQWRAVRFSALATPVVLVIAIIALVRRARD
jgi:hypothetical protein